MAACRLPLVVEKEDNRLVLVHRLSSLQWLPSLQSMARAHGLRFCGAQAPVVPPHGGFFQARDQTCVPYTGRQIFIPAPLGNPKDASFFNSKCRFPVIPRLPGSMGQILLQRQLTFSYVSWIFNSPLAKREPLFHPISKLPSFPFTCQAIFKFSEYSEQPYLTKGSTCSQLSCLELEINS